jgi:hypothetical protein
MIYARTTLRYPGRNAGGPSVHEQCSAFLRKACSGPETPYANLALFLGLTRQAHRTLVNASGELPVRRTLLPDLCVYIYIYYRLAFLAATALLAAVFIGRQYDFPVDHMKLRTPWSVIGRMV